MLFLGTFQLSKTISCFIVSFSFLLTLPGLCITLVLVICLFSLHSSVFCINSVSFSFHLTRFCCTSLTHSLSLKLFLSSLCCFDSDAVIRLSILILSCQCSSVHSELQLPPPLSYLYPFLSLLLPCLPSLSLPDNRNADGMSKRRLAL